MGLGGDEEGFGRDGGGDWGRWEVEVGHKREV